MLIHATYKRRVSPQFNRPKQLAVSIRKPDGTVVPTKAKVNTAELYRELGHRNMAPVRS